MKPTTEQQTIVTAASKRENLAIQAFAGAGKTSTLNLIAKEVTRPSLYIAFNKAIAEEATGKFPIWVDCKTLHSLAYQAIITPAKMFKKVSGFVDTKEIIELLDDELKLYTDSQVLEVVFQTLDVLKAYCQSASFDLEDFVVYFLEGDESTPLILKCIDKVWKAMTSKESKVKMTHDVYLKLFQLSKPTLDQYEVIYLDEAQDSNPVSLDIFYRQVHAQLILVGDPYQSIYEWRGAIDAFQSIPDSFSTYFLSESFRFTSEIARLASKLTYIAGNDREIKGNASREQVKSKAFICRTNNSILARLLMAVQDKSKVYVLADLKDLWSKMYHLSALSAGSKLKFPNKAFAGFHNINELRLEAEHNPELRKFLNLFSIISSGRGTHANIVAIKEVIVEEESEADFTISTAHKSKGLEWDMVTLDDDMLDLEDEDRELVKVLQDGQCLNLLYVSITRAKQVVNIPASVMEVISRADELRADW